MTNVLPKKNGGQVSMLPIQVNIPFWFTENLQSALPINLIASDQSTTITVELEFAAQEDVSLLHFRTLKGATRNYTYHANSHGSSLNNHCGTGLKINPNIVKNINLDIQCFNVDSKTRNELKQMKCLTQKVKMVDNTMLNFAETEINHLCKFPTLALIWAYLEKDGDSGRTRIIDNWATEAHQSWNQYGSHDKTNISQKNRGTNRKALTKNIGNLVKDLKFIVDSTEDLVSSNLTHYSTTTTKDTGINSVPGILHLFGDNIQDSNSTGDFAGCLDKSIELDQL